MAERKELILDALGKGASGDDIQKLLNQREYLRGKSSEGNFARQIGRIFGWLVDSVETPSRAEDFNRGIDFWIGIKKNDRFPLLGGLRLPAQVKSSPERIEEFRKSEKYQALGKKIFVVNANIYISRAGFKDQVLSEARRISRILTKERENVHS